MEFEINYDDMNWAAIGPEFIVLGTAFFLLLAGLKKELNHNPFLSMVTLCGVGAAFILTLFLWGDAPTATNGNNPDIFSSALIHDRFSLAFNLIILSMALFPVFGSVRYPQSDHENKAEYFTLLLMSIAGMMFLAKSGNLITIFLSLELFSISLYILCGFSAKHGTGKEGPGTTPELSWATKASQESAVKYLLTGAFASAVLVYGMALIYAGSGTTEIRLIGQLVQENPYTKNTLVYMGMGLMFCGLAFKVSLVPFHSWTPDVYQGAPTPITGFMSVATKAAVFAVIARVFFTSFAELDKTWMPILFGASVLTMLVGNTAAIFQDDLKRMLAYSGVAHAGYLLIGIVTNTQEGMASILFYLSVYLFMNIGAFAVVFMMEGEGQEGNSINRFKGLAKRSPFLAAAMSLFMVSLAGFPPTAGFFGKLFLFYAAIEQGYFLITILAVVASIISVYFYLRVIVMMYFHEDESAPKPAMHKGMRALVTVSSIAVIAIGLFPSFLMELAREAIPF
ncbi:MAG TPA: NADH-quinone oxidoreductase subunit N [Nitrospinae bacterium]|nr:NADH-quinone oxidoreductase subunit N [Nitrospinota bacterium]